MRQLLALLAALLLAPASGLQAAEPKLSGVFCDHAVLQRDMPVPIWGWSTPDDAVTVEFAGQTKTTTAEAGGQWRVTLDPMPASAEPRELRVSGRSGVALCQDVVVGESDLPPSAIPVFKLGIHPRYRPALCGR